MPRRTRLLASVALAAVIGLCASCSTSSSAKGAAITLRLGYFANITHATAIAGVDKGIFARHLGEGVKLEPKIFSAGAATVEALFSGALDAAYVGPNPAINAHTRSHGAAVRIVAGATSGGAFLVVKPSIKSAADLKGKKLASPQRGNTQDVALRSWLGSQGFKNTLTGGGDVSVLPQENAQTLESFKSGAIDGAWVPEPWASRLVIEGSAHVLVDERTLWPKGRYATTLLIVRTEFLKEHKDTVRRLLQGHVEADDFVNQAPAEAKTVVADGMAKITGKQLASAVVDRAWSGLTFTIDPLVATLRASATNAAKLGFLDGSDLDGIEDLGILNAILRQSGKAAISP